MGKSTISMVTFNSYVSLPEGTWSETANKINLLPEGDPIEQPMGLLFQAG